LFSLVNQFLCVRRFCFKSLDSSAQRFLTLVSVVRLEPVSDPRANDQSAANGERYSDSPFGQHPGLPHLIDIVVAGTVTRHKP
jgi:hypothetical protein